MELIIVPVLILILFKIMKDFTLDVYYSGQRTRLKGLPALLVLPVYVIFTIRSFSLRFDEKQRIQALRIADVDNMDGRKEFPEYVGHLLRHQGYSGVLLTGRPGDKGVDLVAKKDGKKYSIQAKRQATPVPRNAVSDAVGGIKEYGCNASMVVTNNYFTKGAYELAESNHTKLINRDILGKWIDSSQKHNSKEAKNNWPYLREDNLDPEEIRGELTGSSRGRC